ncbi:ribosome-binding protein 1 isoform X2 [Sitophilus oryzae]|uniref:Ribosome-binding protein 1 isoform X2 n=1 Tax=Sitophilus oryzae TaxID=7048 RepID=A0A6J2YJE8_SITOR|nr:ribosome-binding protein 1 isoform X2 [Sitophilus oryzae]
MDIAVPLIFVGVLVIGSFSLFLVFKLGIKKKSYEEALAEHRKQTSALLGPKLKPKEKKSKKAAKKVNKEKSSGNNIENETPEETESPDPKNIAEKVIEKTSEKSKVTQQEKSVNPKGKPSPKHPKIHVDFKEEPEEVPVEIPVEKEVKEVINKKRVKKVRPILVNKGAESVSSPVILEAPTANHFETIHPKDDLELLRSISKDDVRKSEQAKEEKKQPEKSSKKNKQQKQEIPAEKPTPPAEPQPVEKDKPKEVKTVNSVATVSSNEPLPNTGKEKKKKKGDFNAKQQMIAERDQLIYTVQHSELSRTEVQLLIDLLLNKQLEAPAVIDDWSEGKSDPVQKLKKQLAEKEKLLADEQELLVGVQAKLKEVRSEQLQERSQWQQKVRASEEGKIELVANHNRLQQKIQELDDLRNKDLVQLQRLVDDNNALKMQRDSVVITCQETEALIHGLKTDNTNLNNELQRLQQQFQEQAATYQSNVMQQEAILQEELRMSKEYIIDLERKSAFAIQAHAEEKRILTDNMHKEEQRLQEIIKQLKLENRRLQEEKSIQMNGSSDDNKAHEVKMLNLTNELSSVKSELSSVNQRFHEAEKQYQTELKTSSDCCSQLQSELEEQKNKNNELRKKNWKVMEALNAAESRNKPATVKTSESVDVDKLSSEIKNKERDSHKEFLQRLFPNLEGLKSVSVDDWQPEYQRLILQHVSDLEKQTSVAVSTGDQGEEVAKLKREILRYQSIIDDADGALKKLECNIEQEERKWRNQLAEKEAELEELKHRHVCQPRESRSLSSPDVNGITFAYTCIERSLPQIIEELQNRVTSLEKQLEQERIENQRLLEERQQISNKHEVKTIHADSTATIEKLSEEVDRLKEQLRVEQTKNGDTNVYQNGKSS